MSETRRKFLQWFGGGAFAASSLVLPEAASAFGRRRPVQNCSPTFPQGFRQSNQPRRLIDLTPFKVGFPTVYGMEGTSKGTPLLIDALSTGSGRGMFYMWGNVDVATNQPFQVQLLDVDEPNAAYAEPMSERLLWDATNKTWMFRIHNLQDQLDFTFRIGYANQASPTWTDPALIYCKLSVLT